MPIDPRLRFTLEFHERQPDSAQAMARRRTLDLDDESRALLRELDAIVTAIIAEAKAMEFTP